MPPQVPTGSPCNVCGGVCSPPPAPSPQPSLRKCRRSQDAVPNHPPIWMEGGEFPSIGQGLMLGEKQMQLLTYCSKMHVTLGKIRPYDIYPRSVDLIRCDRFQPAGCCSMLMVFFLFSNCPSAIPQSRSCITPYGRAKPHLGFWRLQQSVCGSTYIIRCREHSHYTYS